MALASWPVSMLPDYRADVVLSVGLTVLDQANVATDVHPAAISHESRPTRTNVNRPQPRHARDNEHNSNSDNGIYYDPHTVERCAFNEYTAPATTSGQDHRDAIHGQV